MEEEKIKRILEEGGALAKGVCPCCGEKINIIIGIKNITDIECIIKKENEEEEEMINLINLGNNETH